MYCKYPVEIIFVGYFCTVLHLECASGCGLKIDIVDFVRFIVVIGENYTTDDSTGELPTGIGTLALQQ